MSVLPDVNGTLANGGGLQVSTPYTVYTQNVTAGATALVVVLKFNALAATIGTVTLTWDSGGTSQSMGTPLIQKDGTNTGLWIFGLRNPTSGTAKVLSVAWSGGANQHIEVCGVSYTGSNVTSDALAFPTANRTTNAGTSLTPSVVVTSATGNQVIAILTEDGTGSNSALTANQTAVFASGQGNPSCGTRAAGAATVTLSGTENIGSDLFIAAGVDIAAAGAATLVTGWDFIQDDIYPKRQNSISAAPAFVSTFKTAPISGMAWREPVDDIRIPPRVSFSAQPAFARTPPSVPISGMAWFEPRDKDYPARVNFLTDPVATTYAPQTVSWSFSVGDTTFLRDAPVDTSPGYGHPAFAAPVGISGMAWFTPLDWSKAKVSFDGPAAFPVRPPVGTPISGISWFEPPDRDKPATKIRIESPPAIALTPATLPVPIRGMAWFEPPDRDRPATKFKLDNPPAWIFFLQAVITGSLIATESPDTVSFTMTYRDLWVAATKESETWTPAIKQSEVWTDK